MNLWRLLFICFARSTVHGFLVFPIGTLPETRRCQPAVRKGSLAWTPSPNLHWPVFRWRHWKRISNLFSIIIPRSPAFLCCCSSLHLLLSRLLYYWITMQKRISPEVLDWIFFKIKKKKSFFINELYAQFVSGLTCFCSPTYWFAKILFEIWPNMPWTSFCKLLIY